MSGSAGRDARSFGIVLLAAIAICVGVTGDGGFFWALLALGPVIVVARALDGK